MKTLPEITVRSVVAADHTFLGRVYASTRQEEMAQVDWSEEEKESFLRFQFEAQHKYYMQQFPDAQFDIIEKEGEPIGRLYVDRREDEIRLIDIALLPEHRKHGIGGAIMRQLLSEAENAGKPIRIHVERFNPALRLYERLGFRSIEDQGVYFLMEWSPAQADGASQQTRS